MMMMMMMIVLLLLCYCRSDYCSYHSCHSGLGFCPGFCPVCYPFCFPGFGFVVTYET